MDARNDGGVGVRLEGKGPRMAGGRGLVLEDVGGQSQNQSASSGRNLSTVVNDGRGGGRAGSSGHLVAAGAAFVVGGGKQQGERGGMLSRASSFDDRNNADEDEDEDEDDGFWDDPPKAGSSLQAASARGSKHPGSGSSRRSFATPSTPRGSFRNVVSALFFRDVSSLFVGLLLSLLVATFFVRL